MRVFIGQSRGRKMIANLKKEGFGEITQPDEYPPRRGPWVLDNAAFKFWRRGKTWDRERFELAVGRFMGDGNPPAWIAVPDRVAEGLESLRFSRTWCGWLSIAAPGVPRYLVVQDGMSLQDVAEAMRSFAGIFVGGTLDWKLKTGGLWVGLAHALGKPCHVGRVGTAKRVKWAIRIGADSIDSCLPLWSEDNLRRFIGALKDRQQYLPLQ